MKNFFAETYDIISKKIKETPKPEPKATEEPSPKRLTAGALTPEELKAAIIKGSPQYISPSGATPYTDLAFEEYNCVVKPLQQKLKDIRAKQRELFDRGQEASKSNNKPLADVISKKQLDLIALEKETQKQLNKARADYQPDLNLVYLAKKLDTADSVNRGLGMMEQLYRQIESLLPMMARASTCYAQGNAQIPRALVTINGSIGGLIHSLRMNSASNGLRQIDKAETEVKFNAALEAYKKQIAQKEEAEQFYYIDKNGGCSSGAGLDGFEKF